MQVGSYQVLFELARGGMGTVFLARAIGAGGFERLVAIKRAHAGAGADAAATERFVAEARVAAQVHHANVVSTHLADIDAEGHFLVCDYVEGASLAQLIERAGARSERVPIAISLRIAADALAGLHAVHEATSTDGTALGILHRDVSPQNLLVGRDGVTRLSDFGIAKSTQNQALTTGQAVMGKLVYLAPEYLQRLPVGRSLDIYALGIVLWVALSGHDPWADVSDAQLIEQITQHGVPAFSALQLGLDPLIEQVVERACRRDASWRYQSARDMHEALEQAARKAGCIAEQREVAAYVENVFGAELNERRERIRRRSRELSHGTRLDGQPRARRTPLVAGLLAAAGVSMALVGLYRMREQRPATPAVAPAVRAPAARATDAAVAAPPPATEPVSPLPNAAPAPAAAPRVSPPPTAAARKRAPRARPRDTPIPATNPHTEPQPFGNVPSVNPYRKPTRSLAQ